MPPHCVNERARYNKFLQNERDLKVLPFYINSSKNVTRHLFFAGDGNTKDRTTVSNIPPFLAEEGLKQIINASSGIAVKEVSYKKSTARNSDVTMGYRYGSVLFHTKEECHQFLESLDSSLEPISLEEVTAGLGLFGLKKFSQRYNSKFVSPNLLRDNISASLNGVKLEKEEMEPPKKKNKIDKEGWKLVTKKDKHSFRGKPGS